MKVEVVYGNAHRQVLYTVDVRHGATVLDAIEQSGVRSDFPDVTLDQVGIFSRKVTLETQLEDGDRVEIYRLLLIDPKEARRRRAKQLLS